MMAIKARRPLPGPFFRNTDFHSRSTFIPTAISHLRSYLTWEDLRYLAAMGVDIESHTLTHPLLTHPGKAMNPPEYLAWLDKELRDSRADPGI